MILFLNIILFLFSILIRVKSVSESDFKVESIGNEVSDLGEGPYWDERTYNLYYVDISDGQICKLSVIKGTTGCIQLNDEVSIVITY